jgi:hypothetical protein
MLVIAIPAVVVIGFGIYIASLAGELPWQSDPTRVPITPFAGIPGFTPPTPVPSPGSSPTP